MYNRFIHFLDRCYVLCAYLSGICLIIILVLVDTQVIFRQIDIPLKFVTAYSGYLLGASIFFGCAYTLRTDGHIRVELLIDRLGSLRFVGEIWSFIVATLIFSLVGIATASGLYWSIIFGDRSQGLDNTPLWIPQAILVVGAVVFFIGLIDGLVRCMILRHETYLAPSSQSFEGDK